MKLEHSFTVKATLDETWALLTDLERIAPCMPGAELIGRDGDAYKGRVRVKLGPVLAQYEGKASFAQRDDAAKRGVLQAEGRETKGQGSAKATVTASLAATPEGTQVRVETDLAIVGRLAQMGRGLIAEVSGKLLGEFVANLEREIAASAAPAETAAPAPTPEIAAQVAPPAELPRRAAASAAESHAAAMPPEESPAAPPLSAKPLLARREAAPVDLLAAAGVPVLKRVIPLAIAAALLIALLIWLL
ncbi:MAG: SRPBCC family protein [Myxococcota bacterium]